jgi:hypothetical protein
MRDEISDDPINPVIKSFFRKDILDDEDISLFSKII